MSQTKSVGLVVLVLAMTMLGATREASAITRDQIIARAQPWIEHHIPYCQSPNGKWDSYCNYACNWPGSFEFDAWRSDCSGYVSWAWGLPAPGKLVSGFWAISDVINAADLKPGDALIKSGHIMLFVGWNDGSHIKVWHESDCGVGAVEKDYKVSYGGSSINVGWATFTAIRFHEVVDDILPKGVLDQLGCRQIWGWGQDPDVPGASTDVHVYFNGAAGDPKATVLKTSANRKRDDLCSALGSCNHGFLLPTPRSLLDDQPHPVHIYGIGQNGGGNAKIAQGSLNCPPPVIGSSAMLRRVVSDESFAQWKFSTFQDVAPMPDSGEKVSPNQGMNGPDLPLTPQVVQADDGSGGVWLIDSGARRRVPDQEAMAAWRLGAPTSMPAPQLYQFPKGADLPPIPELVVGHGPAFYVIDTPFQPQKTDDPPEGAGGSGGEKAGAGGSPAGSAGGPKGTAASGGNQAKEGPTGSSTVMPQSDESESGGCAVQGPAGGSGRGAAGVALGLALALRRLAALGLKFGARRSRRGGR